MVGMCYLSLCQTNGLNCRQGLKMQLISAANIDGFYFLRIVTTLTLDCTSCHSAYFGDRLSPAGWRYTNTHLSSLGILGTEPDFFPKRGP